MKLVLLGNAGAGKSTLARRLMGGRDIPRLSLDEIAWDEGVARKPLAESIALLEDFVARHPEWIIEGCYGDLIAAALPHCEQLRFLNPGVEVCVALYVARPCEPKKFPRPAAPGATLHSLVGWVRA